MRGFMGISPSALNDPMLHFTNEETKLQRSKRTCPSSLADYLQWNAPRPVRPAALLSHSPSINLKAWTFPSHPLQRRCTWIFKNSTARKLSCWYSLTSVKYVGIRSYTAAFFNDWEQPNSPSTRHYSYIQWYIHVVAYYAVIKKNALMWNDL